MRSSHIFVMGFFYLDFPVFSLYFLKHILVLPKVCFFLSVVGKIKKVCINCPCALQSCSATFFNHEGRVFLFYSSLVYFID
jgi:hypothetical protein